MDESQVGTTPLHLASREQLGQSGYWNNDFRRSTLLARRNQVRAGAAEILPDHVGGQRGRDVCRAWG